LCINSLFEAAQPLSQIHLGSRQSDSPRFPRPVWARGAQCIVARFVHNSTRLYERCAFSSDQTRESREIVTGVVQLGPTSLASKHDTMPVSNHTSAEPGPSTRSFPQVGSGLAAQNSNTARSRRNSFDMILDAAKTQAASPQASLSSGNESGPYWSDRPSLTSRAPNRQAADVENQAETFEDIELQDWPTASRPATDVPALAVQAPSAPTRQLSQSPQPPLSPDAMRRALAASPPKSSDLNGEVGLWDDVVAMMGAMLRGKMTMDE
jgi:hypothetical protein